jgi:hypothetical protein
VILNIHADPDPEYIAFLTPASGVEKILYIPHHISESLKEKILG